MSFDIIVVGAGAAGVFAAMNLRSCKTLIVDVGQSAPENHRLEGNLFQARQEQESLFPELIGERFESLHNIHNSYLSLKLKPPLMRYIFDGWQSLFPIQSDTFEPVIGMSKGGLANGWGAGAFRYNAEDLADFPISSDDLTPYYDAVEREMGVCGENDDLASYFGDAQGLMPPPRLNAASSEFYRRYARHRSYFHRRGLRVGRLRLAILTRKKGEREPLAYDNREFFQSHIPAFYTPAYTLDKIIKRREVTYRDSIAVARFEETHDGVTLYGTNLKDGSPVNFRARRLVLAAGALNSARIALASSGDYTTCLPILDNPISYVPLINLRRIGATTQIASLAVQLAILYKGPLAPYPVQGTYYDVMGTLRSDIIFDLFLPVRGMLAASRFVVPALSVIQLFYPSEPSPDRRLALMQGGKLRIDYPPVERGAVERHILKTMLRAGYIGFPSLCRYPAPGNSFHYAGCLSMRAKPDKPYETWPTGRLNGYRKIFVADSATFPRLPAKHVTMTIMANAMRVAKAVSSDLAREKARG